MRTSLGPGDGSGKSPYLKTSGEPVRVKYTAFITTLLKLLASSQGEINAEYVSIPDQWAGLV
jgi:hypothetical protein